MVAKHGKITAGCNKPYLFDANWITKARKYLSMAYHANIVWIAEIDLNSMLLEEAHPDSKQMVIAERWK